MNLFTFIKHDWNNGIHFVKKISDLGTKGMQATTVFCSDHKLITLFTYKNNGNNVSDCHVNVSDVNLSGIIRRNKARAFILYL